MSKLKNLLPNLFSSNKNAKNKENGTVGHLEKDACTVDDDETYDQNIRVANNQQSTNSPTVSTELSESVVRELSDPNYNSATGAVMDRMDMDSNGMTNTMNVQNNQQQNIVMQFSNASNLHFGSVYNFNNNVTTTNTKGPVSEELNGDSKNPNVKRRKPKTRTIVAMMQSTEEPNHRMLDTIASHLGEGWKQIMRDLGHSEGQIEQAIIDHQIHGGIKEVIYRLLLQWIRGADDDEATIGRITKLLWESNQRDCVERMKVVFKSEEKRKPSI